MPEEVILVNKHDEELGSMEKIEAHKKAALHRAVSVFIFNSNGEMLLQKRSLRKYHSPGLWTNTACTHPMLDESNTDAAIRRLYQEIGINEENLIKVFDFIYKEKLDNELTEHELDHVFIGISDKTPNPNPDEVCDFMYIKPKLLIKHVNQNPHEYTAWFKIIVERVINAYKNYE